MFNLVWFRKEKTMQPSLDAAFAEQLLWSAARTARCHDSIHRSMKFDDKHEYRIPTVGVAVSGGGHRAMLSVAAATPWTS